MAELTAALKALLARDCLDNAAARRVYARDASHMEIGEPACICLPRTAEQVAAIVKLCRRYKTPYVARGAGTGLSGGALPTDGAVVISLARLTHLTSVDKGRHSVWAGAGVTNEAVSIHAAPSGLEFAPDPGSRAAATIGGNIAENAGGPHCLKTGVTAAHIRALQWVDGSGVLRTTDLTRGICPARLLIGSEGTLGIVTAAELNLVPVSECASTLLAFFDDLREAASAVVSLMTSGLWPAAVEMIDRNMLQLVEEAFEFGFPTDHAAAMIVELAGSREAVAADAEQAVALLKTCGAWDVQLAADDARREELWRCRRRAFGAVGRLSPNYVTMDIAVPLGALPDFVMTVERIGEECDVRIATALHAADGNLHPGVLYDARDAQSKARADRAADLIIRAALDAGGTVTGEHGVGVEKLEYLSLQLGPLALELMLKVKSLFDPDNLCNPGKALTEPGDGKVRPAPIDIKVDKQSLLVHAPARARWRDVQDAARRHGLCVTCAAHHEDQTVGDLVQYGTDARDNVLELWVETGDGRPLYLGSPTLKNVAGYDLLHMLVGTGEMLVTVRAATFALKPAFAEPPALNPPVGPAMPVDMETLRLARGLKDIFDPQGQLRALEVRDEP
jgi:glycolate oxidase subunit GlcD